MMKRLLSLVFTSAVLFSCGSSLQDTSGVSPTSDYNPVERSYLVFDPFSTEASSPIGIPFPNDLFWAEDGGVVKIKTDGVEDPAQKAFYEAINALELKGLSPNTPIFIPLSSETPVDLGSLEGKVLLVDLTALESLRSRADETDLTALIEQSSRLEARQEGRYLKFYPVKPLEPGHRYLFVLLSGIKDQNGNALLPAQVYDELESKEPLSDPQLEALRQKYRELYDGVFPVLSQLLGVELNEETVDEAFTFTTANKTLSIQDFGALEAYLEGETSDLRINGLPYSSLGLDFGALLQPLSSQDFVRFVAGLATYFSFKEGKPLFPAISIKKLQAFVEKVEEVAPRIASGELSFDSVDWGEFVKFIPVFVGNQSLYDGKVYVFQHGLGGNRLRAEALLEGIPLTVVDLPFHGDYTKLTEADEVNPACVAEVDGQEVGTGKCFLTSNVISNRLNTYQAAFNLLVFEKLIAAGAYDLNGDGAPDIPSEVNFVGVSMGAITGELAYKNASYLNKAVFSVGGGNYVSIIDAATDELITGLLEATGLTKNTNAYAVTLGIFQLVLDPADPSYFPLDGDKPSKTLFQSACCDTVVPPVSNHSFAVSLFGSTVSPVQLKTVEEFENPPVEPGWYVYGDSEHWVIHSFLLKSSLDSYPEVVGHTTEDYLEAATKGAQKQAYLFLKED